MSKAPTNCWTCKQRKVGCDRRLPTCLNCEKAQRGCQGYGLRLAWPDKQDGRRKQKRYEVTNQEIATRHLTQDDGRLVFLNTGVGDFDGSMLSVSDLIRGELISVVPAAVPRPRTFIPIPEQDGILLSHYDLAIARITTTIDDDSNGFRMALIPMALSSSDSSARSILHSTLAVASYHLGRPEQALEHKYRAINSLSDSLANLSIGADTTAKTRLFAACMMLCVYGVFDESDTAWHLHLQGAKSIYDTIPEIKKSAPGFEFLRPWFEYHYIFSQYSHPTKNATSPIVLPCSTPENRRIIGVLGCSTEVLRLIGCINQLRLPKPCPSNPHKTTYQSYSSTLLAQIESRLLTLTQDLHTHPGSTSGPIDRVRITLTAELYRIAALLYFYQTAHPSFFPTADPTATLRSGLDILWKMHICSSPWPLFILACSVTDDEDRVRVLSLMERSGTRRRIGNYGIIIALVKAVWKRGDLLCGNRRVDWRELVEEGGFMPSFI